uniref:AB hydrolase-1 domain-containing protein n=1 Tax=Globodera pallida TaxID=36090 RepID=A0A183BSP0_GLOPA
MASRPISLPKNQADFIVRQAMEWLGSEFFSKSWGPPELLKKLQQHQNKYPLQGALMEIVERRMPTMVIEKEWVKDGVQFMEGWFRSPLETLLPGVFNAGGDTNLNRAAWRAIVPMPGAPRRALVVNLAPTGDQGYWRRENFFQAAQMCKQDGISSILLTNPFYGDRRPKAQSYSRLINVSDLFVMGGCLMLESCFLLLWASQQGFHPLGLTGVSMGGHMASLASTNIRCANGEPIALVPCLSWTSAAPVFTQGLLARAVRWDVLSAELSSNMALRRVLDECGWAAMLADDAHVSAQLFPGSPAHRLMWILMEEFTNLGHYPAPPVRDGTLRFVVAEQDEYVPHNEHVLRPEALWQRSAQVHVVPGVGHVWAYLKHHPLFRQSIVNSMATISGTSSGDNNNIGEIIGSNMNINNNNSSSDSIITSSSSSPMVAPNVNLNWMFRRLVNNVWTLRRDNDNKNGEEDSDGGPSPSTTTAAAAASPHQQQ